MAPVLVRLTVPLKLLPAVLTLIAPLLAVKLVLPLATLMLALADLGDVAGRGDGERDRW